MHLPTPRGILSQHAAGVLAGCGAARPAASPLPYPTGQQLLTDDDFQLALWMLFELHYRGFDDVDPDLEWDPQVLHMRSMMERCLEESLRALVASDVPPSGQAAHTLATQLADLIDDLDRGTLANYLRRRATRDQFADFLRQRSIYHLKESDPQSFVLPRIDGAAKAALAELQYDEYGAGRPERLHARLFADALDAMGLDSSYGAWIDETTGITLAVNNVMSMFALRRRLRGAALGHLAAFESTSSVPCRRILSGIERLGLPAAVAAYFDEHVEADAVHEQLAIHGICGALVDDEPELADDVLFGAACCLRVEELAGKALIASWKRSEEPEHPRLQVLA